jgi:hypothetical protein
MTIFWRSAKKTYVILKAHSSHANTSQINCGDCKPISWTNPLKGESTTPPTGTVAIVIDVRGNKGAIRIYEVSGRSFRGSVGLEEAGKMVIIPWDSGWYYSAAGSLPVGHIVEKT